VIAVLILGACVAQPEYRNPAGSVILGGSIGVATGDLETAFNLGVSIGYAVVTGIVPSLRGVLIAGDGVGGELAATLTLSPPIDWPVVPFAVAEGGHRWERYERGWIFGGGGGVLIGWPTRRMSLQLGWIVRRYGIAEGAVTVMGPLFGVVVSR